MLFPPLHFNSSESLLTVFFQILILVIAFIFFPFFLSLSLIAFAPFFRTSFEDIWYGGTILEQKKTPLMTFIQLLCYVITHYDVVYSIIAAPSPS